MQSNWLRYAGFEEVGKAAASGLAFSRSWLSESGLRCDLSAKAEVESELELEQHILIAQPGLNGKTEMVPHWDMRARSHRDTTVLDLHLLPAAVPHASEIDAPCLDRSACESMMIQNRRFRLLNVSVDGLLDGLSKSTTDLDLYSHNSISRAVAPGVNNCAKSE